MNGKFNFIRIAERTDNSVVIEFSIPEESPYLDGHFPQLGVLPAVAQVELVSIFAKEYFNSNIIITEIKRVKFTGFIMASVPLMVHINKNGNNISFKIKSPDGETVYSSGALIIKE